MPAATSKTKSPAKKGQKPIAARKRAAQGVSLAGALAEAAWAEADKALAQALADFDEVEGAADENARADALEMLAQSLSRAARKRGLTRIAVLGEREPYDAKRHDLVVKFAKMPKTVRIQARGVARGGVTLVKPRVGPVRRKRRP